MMESLRQQVQLEVEKPFREKLAELDGELEKCRSDYKKLKYDHTFLKSEYEHEAAEHKRIVNELTLRYEAEVCSATQQVVQLSDLLAPCGLRGCKNRAQSVS